MHAQREVQKVKKCLTLPRRLIGAARYRPMAEYWQGHVCSPVYDLCYSNSWLHLCGTTGSELCQVHSETAATVSSQGPAGLYATCCH